MRLMTICATPKSAAYVIMLIVMVLAVEALSYGILILIQNQYGLLVYDGKQIKESRVEAYANFDPHLGWLPRQEVDDFGARIDASDFSNSHTCIEMYGDSFTWSAEVEKQFAWPSLISDLIGCRVLNFGVSGYGSDQALMRYLKHKNYADIVVLNHLSENIIRNVNQLRNLIYPNGQLTLKPRYIVNGNSLLYVKIPEYYPNNIEDILSYLHNEYFIPDGESGIISSLDFPFTLTAIKFAFNHYHITAKIKREPRHMAFYNYTHPSKALAVTTKIMETFIEEAKVRNQRPLITIVPTCRDFQYFESHSVLPYQNIIDALGQKNISVFDFAIPMLRYETNYHELYHECSAHPNEEGYSLMAKVFVDHLNQVGLIN
jgi:hypothetical protein